MPIDLGAITLEPALISDDLSVMTITLAPGADSGVHRHTRERETFYVLEGELSFWLEEREVLARAGETVSIPVNAVHRFRNASAARAVAVLMLNPGGLARYFGALRELLDRGSSAEEIAQLGTRYGLEFFAARASS
jgi:quercetin dioxygenase-like cupin family protein